MGIIFDYGTRLYLFQYDDSNVRTDYPTIIVFEENMGIDGLRMYMNQSGDGDDALITPFMDPAPIIILVVQIALFLHRGRYHIKKSGLKL